MSHEQVLAIWKHGVAEIEAGLRLHYVTAGDGQRQTILLLHGFPQTWWEWRLVIPPLVEAGFQVVAPDYRGAGQSSRPLSGYDKRTRRRTYIGCCAIICMLLAHCRSWDTISG